MGSVHLVKPSAEYENAFLDMAEDWSMNELGHKPWYIVMDCDFSSWVAKFAGFEKGVGVPDGFVPNSTFWLVNDEKRMLGAINIRHRFNELFLNFGGQIGYGIRPSERGKGYGKEILRLGLVEAGKLGLERVLICCYKDNVASVRIIVANGGVLEDEREHEGKIVRRYWVELSMTTEKH